MLNRNAFSTTKFSHKGLRDENEDRCAVFCDAGGRAVLAVVADGMGGHAGGVLAAEAVVDTVGAIWGGRDAGEDAEAFLQRLVRECHAAVNEAGKPQGIVPRATVAMLFIQVRDGGAQCVSIHAGDCRIIQYGAKGVAAQSIDHSLAQIHVLRGKITQEEAATHPDQSKVLANVGGEETPKAEITHWDSAKGHRFVVCSDGFWEIFREDDVLRLFSVAADEAATGAEHPAREQAIAEMFAEKLSGREKQDNTTAVMVEVNAGKNAAPGADARQETTAWRRGLTRLAAVIAAVFLFFVLLTCGAIGAEAETPSGEMGRELPPTGESLPRGPLQALDMETRIEAEDDEDLAGKISALLNAQGNLGDDDELSVARAGAIGDSRVIRLQQTHGDVLVPAGQLVAVENNGVITHIAGKAAAGIRVDTAPALSFAAAVAALDKVMDETLAFAEAGQLIIFSADDGYHLAWRGHIEVDGETQELVIDAHNAELLARYPVMLR